MARSKSQANSARRPRQSLRERDLNSIGKLNAATSPFLKLPPEIRNRIYHLVLANREIHVNFDGPEYSGPKYRLCSSPPSNREFCSVYRDSRLTSDAFRKPEGLTACEGCDPGTGLAISLLAVCQQIYSEASFLPFYENDFRFDLRIWRNIYFLERLLPEQRRALSRLILVASNMTINSTHQFTDRRLGLNVRDLTLHIDTMFYSDRYPRNIFGDFLRCLAPYAHFKGLFKLPVEHVTCLFWGFTNQDGHVFFPAYAKPSIRMERRILTGGRTFRARTQQKRERWQGDAMDERRAKRLRLGLRSLP